MDMDIDIRIDFGNSIDKDMVMKITF